MAVKQGTCGSQVWSCGSAVWRAHASLLLTLVAQQHFELRERIEVQYRGPVASRLVVWFSALVEAGGVFHEGRVRVVCVCVCGYKFVAFVVCRGL